MPKKHEEHEEHENHEAWVIPYADMLTLLMGLFLVLWSISNTDLGKMRQVSAGFAAAVGAGPSGGALAAGSSSGDSTLTGGGLSSTNQAPDSAAADASAKMLSSAAGVMNQAKAREADIKTEHDQLEKVKQQIQTQLDAKGFGAMVQMRVEPTGLIIVATEGLLFGSGSAGLEASGKGAIDAIAEPLVSLTQPVRIEGHTDNTPIASTVYPSNWELSTARASSVLRYLVEQFSFPANRVSAAGYGDTRPVGDNATAEGRAANRRVEIVVEAVKANEPLPTGTDGVPGSVGVAGTPAPIGADGPLGAPDNLGPATTVAGSTTPTTSTSGQTAAGSN